MSIHRCRSISPAAAPPLEDKDLLSEILLHLPPDPSSLPRASAVCKRWRRLVCDARFIRRFRLHHRRNPPLLGFFKTYGGELFQPTQEAPNRVAPGRFSLPPDRGDHLWPLGCRHGFVLMLNPKRKQAMVWDPVTGEQHRISLPRRFDAEDPLTNGAVLRTAGDVHFQVVLVMTASDEELHRRVLASVYSSETGLWGNLISSPPLPSTNFVSCMPAVLVGDSLYWTLLGEFPAILEFDLLRQSLAVIRLPMDTFTNEYQLTVMRADGGGLGFLLVSEEDLSAQLWKRKTDCHGVASWELGRTIQLDKLLPLNSEVAEDCITILGFAECNNVVFLWTLVGLFMVELESLKLKKVAEAHDGVCCKPFESVYTADVYAAPAPLDHIEGSKAVHSPTKPAAISSSVIVPTATHSIIKSKTEVPRRPLATVEGPQKRPLESLAIGNKQYEKMISSEGRFGIFYERDKTENAFKWAEIDAAVYRRSIFFTIEDVLRRCMVKSGYDNDEDIGRLLTRYVPQLVNGVCMLTYLKIRSVNFALSPEGDRYTVKPKVPVPLEVPLPFAIAISQLGAVEVKSMLRRTIALPAISVAEAAYFMIPQNQCFKAADYAQAVKFAKSLGIEFSSVNLDMKTGSAWWLLRGEIIEEVFHLSLPLPESNFSEDNAILHSMFCLNPDRSFGTTLFNLGDLNAGTYGSILRNPHQGMNANSFFAFCSEPLSTMWKIE